MIEKYRFLIIAGMLFFPHALDSFCQEQVSSQGLPVDSVRIDRIEIERNWMTWDRIILNELLFKEGEVVSYGEIDTSMNRVWNTGNFANVNYRIDHGPEGNVMQIEAHDALQIYPVMAIDHSSENDYQYRLGIGDENFLGSNSVLKIIWDKQPTGASWDFQFKLPRQLMYKNMTVEFGTSIGNDTKVFWDRVITEEDGRKEANFQARIMAPYHKLDIFTSIGNPWHLDYQYRFSPNLTLRYMHDEFDASLLDPEGTAPLETVEDGIYSFFNLQVGESIGTVDRQRHRRNGYTIGISYDLFAGLRGTRNHHEFNLRAEYHKTFSPLFQVSTRMGTAYTSADDQYKFMKGSSDVLGLRTGEIYGKVFYSAYAGGHFTWLNTRWLSLENAYFLNWGNGADRYSELFSSKQKFSAGTFLELRIPMVSWINFRFTFMYAGPGSEWFKFNM